MRGGASTVTFSYYESFHLLTATASPAMADTALQQLYKQLPATGSALASSDSPALHIDDGSLWPDLRSTLRFNQFSTSCERKVDSASDGNEQSEAIGSRDSSICALLPSRPYQWLQWLGGLGPLLTSKPHPSQLVLEKLLGLF